MSLELFLITALLFKHFVADFVLQTPYQVLNKGRYGHPAGLLHVSIHLALSFLVLVAVMEWGSALATHMVMWALFVEAIVHYHMDWLKCQVSQRMDLKPDNCHYWWLTGLDQMVHHATYVVMVLMVV
jgi:hypothetical protein